jgi:hypothetical protein
MARSIATPTAKDSAITSGSAIQKLRLQELPGEIGAEHRHLALGEVDVVGGDEDHHQRQGEAGVNGAIGEAGGHLLDELLHTSSPSQ